MTERVVLNKALKYFETIKLFITETFCTDSHVTSVYNGFHSWALCMRF